MTLSALMFTVALAGLLDRKCERIASTVDQLDREVMACQDRLAAAQESSRHCDSGGPPPPVYTELLQTFADSEVEVLRDGPRVVVVFPGGLLFGGGSVEVRKEAMLPVDLLATAMSLHPELHAWIGGHTSDAPIPRPYSKYHTHRSWSFAQADALAKVLTERFSVAPERLAVAAYGDSRPRAENETEGGRRKNHRIVVILGPSEDWR